MLTYLLSMMTVSASLPAIAMRGATVPGLNMLAASLLSTPRTAILVPFLALGVSDRQTEHSFLSCAVDVPRWAEEIERVFPIVPRC